MTFETLAESRPRCSNSAETLRPRRGHAAWRDGESRPVSRAVVPCSNPDRGPAVPVTAGRARVVA